MPIELTVDGFEDNSVILKTKDGEKVLWPKAKLPISAKVGSIFKFYFSANGEKTASDKQLAKDILNELLDIKNTE